MYDTVWSLLGGSALTVKATIQAAPDDKVGSFFILGRVRPDVSHAA